MKKTIITITHQLEKTTHVYYVIDPDKLTILEVGRINEEMGVEMVFINRKLYK